MARMIIGTLLDIGFGSRRKEEIEEIFEGTAPQARPAIPRDYIYRRSATTGLLLFFSQLFHDGRQLLRRSAKTVSLIEFLGVCGVQDSVESFHIFHHLIHQHGSQSLMAVCLIDDHIHKIEVVV